MTIQEFNKLKTSDIISRYEKWKRLIIDGASIEEMKSVVRSVITGCAFQTLVTTSGKLYRARKNDGDKSFINISDLWYPPHSVIKQMGRANRIGQSMMYLAQDGRTAIFEMQLTNDDYFTVCELNIKENQKLNLIYLNTLENLNIPAQKKIHEERNKGLARLKYNKQGIENINLIHKILSEEFMRTDDKRPQQAYTLSIAVAETLLSYKNADGMIYPSLRVRNDYNIVIHPNAADRTLKINKCDSFKIIEGDNETKTIHQLLTTSNIDYNTGILTWSDNLPANLNWYSSGTSSLVKLT